MTILRRVILSGFKSIRSLDLELRRLNVLIGANGAGKSNLISFFRLLNELAAERLQHYVGIAGRAHSLLHFGPKISQEINAQLEFGNSVTADDGGSDAYKFSLAHAAGDSLFFSNEELLREEFLSTTAFGLGSGHLETHLIEAASGALPQAKRAATCIREVLQSCRVYHFHDTSSTARVRQYGYLGDREKLLFDGGNLAAFLLRQRDDNGGSAYQRIVATIRLVAPFFDDFVLRHDPQSDSNRHELALEWRAKGSDQLFGPHQLSDGTLRAMCLIALLLQPGRS